MNVFVPLVQTDPPGLWFILWWTQDPKVWASVLTFAVGLTGALVGGVFTVGTANRARKNQIEDLRRAAADADVRTLHAKFVELMTTIDRSPADIAVAIGAVSWLGDWKGIWTPRLRSELRVGADVIPNENVRLRLTDVITYLNSAREYSRDGTWPGHARRDLRRLVGMLAAEGVDILSAYLRGDAHATKRAELLDALESESKAYAAWEEHAEAASERAAEVWWQSLSEEDRKKAKEEHTNLLVSMEANASSQRVAKAKAPSKGEANREQAGTERPESQDTPPDQT